VELLHGATLIHDDVIDRAPLRRGKPTIYASGGAKRAVLVGDYLLAQSLELASKANDNRLVQVMTKGVSRLCSSEIEQDFSQGKLFITREDYYGRIRGKTAELFALSCFAGALLSGADRAVCDDFYQAGLDFGMAFQIDDDVLDYRGKGSRMGKRTGEDLRAGIPTLPLILALEHEGPSL
jgi:heptaprenyl diphosphate synthase